MAPNMSSAMMLVRFIPTADQRLRIAEGKGSTSTADNKFFPQSEIRNPISLAPLAVGRGHLTQKFNFIEAFACSFRHRAQRILRNMDRQTCFLAQKFVEP